ncbi:Centromere protein Cenp-H [Penicillium expansum]|uniref:Centromere protein Cenp-H n=1 Tax=Penicillium expansum TaxID=27334 RepID=A0A0A2K6L5_PENEN|nr:Centromere protein Cenp-H [Penicillium expansum]KGO36905.1 Centromere protein Cenp-H [Penicillium expansum]KGO51430.1 Centromere protein Cenp-H [Penicillium expansum]KGO63484.1 Centromere protein Cenp-H [Penicillium expansum]
MRVLKPPIRLVRTLKVAPQPRVAGEARPPPPVSSSYHQIPPAFMGSTSMAEKHGQSLPHLQSGEVTLLDYSADDSRDVVTLSDKEALVLQLYNQVQEQQLEKAFLEQELESFSGADAEEQLTIAERELLEARSTYTVRRKAVRTILMTEPILKAVHLKAATPAERALLCLVNRRDVLALAHENLASAHDLVMRQLSNLEVKNLQINRENQELVRQLLELTKEDSSWREKLEDPELLSQLDRFETDLKTRKAQWETMKSIASAVVVASGLNWADDDILRALVLDESDD